MTIDNIPDILNKRQYTTFLLIFTSSPLFLLQNSYLRRDNPTCWGSTLDCSSPGLTSSFLFLSCCLSSFCCCFSSSSCIEAIKATNEVEADGLPWKPHILMPHSIGSFSLLTCCFLSSASRRTASLKGALFGTPGSFLGFLWPRFLASFLNFRWCSRTY